MSAPLTPYEHGTTLLRDGRELGWAAFGDPDGDAVFWFHGTPGGRAQLPFDAEHFARQHRLRIIGVERPGTGDSTRYRYQQVIEFVDDFRQVADDLRADRFACVGLSGGGPFVLAVAHEMADRMVCGAVLGGVGPTRGADAILSHTLLLVPAAGLLERVAEPLGQGVSTLIRHLAPYADTAVDLFFKLQPGDRRAMDDRPLDKRQMTADLIDANHRSGLYAPFEDLILFGKHWGFELNEIKVPVTFYAGNSDIIVPYLHAERQAKRVPRSRLRTHQGRGHFAGYTSTDEVLSDLRQLWPESPAPAEPTAPPRKAAAAKRAPKATAQTGRSARRNTGA